MCEEKKFKCKKNRFIKEEDWKTYRKRIRGKK
jgi:hypothetical protein